MWRTVADAAQAAIPDEAAQLWPTKAQRLSCFAARHGLEFVTDNPAYCEGKLASLVPYSNRNPLTLRNQSGTSVGFLTAKFRLPRF